MATVKIKRNSAGLKDALFEAIEALRAGDIEPQEAREIANLSKEIVSVTRLELDVFNYQMTNHLDKADRKLPVLNLAPENDGNVQALQAPVSGDDNADR
jgi:hypothetical protein